MEQAITKSEVQVLLGKNNICPVKSIEEEILCTVPDISKCRCALVLSIVFTMAMIARLKVHSHPSFVVASLN